MFSLLESQKFSKPTTPALAVVREPKSSPQSPRSPQVVAPKRDRARGLGAGKAGEISQRVKATGVVVEVILFKQGLAKAQRHLGRWRS